MKQDTPPPFQDTKHHGKGRTLSIGISVPRADAHEKVTGRTRYAADYYGENPVWLGVKRAGIPHARLIRIDATRAEQLPGVIRVLTHEHVRGTNRQGVVRKDQPVLVNDKVRHSGDALALVLAEDKNVLRQALALIEVHTEPLPGIFDVHAALQEHAVLVHEDNPDGNVLLKGDLTIGSSREAEPECDVLVEASFQTTWQEHAYLETESGWARVDEDGRLVVVCSSQTPFRDRSEVAEALGLDQEQVRIMVPYVGGAFGGKDGITVQSLLGLGALHSGGRPVKMWWDREESFLSGSKRHPALMRYRLGAKKDGTLHFLDAELLLDTGPYDHLGGVVMTLGLEHAGGPYRIPHARLSGRAVYTNNPVSGAFRGFGVTQVTAAIEQTMDMLAAKLDMDPMELRLKNAVERGDRNCVGKTLVCSTGLVECLEKIRDHRFWKDRDAWRAEAGLFKRRGVGIAAVMQASGYGPVVPDYANAKVELTPDGRIVLYCGVVDMGQGNASTNLQIVGALLGQHADVIELVQPDTDRTLRSCSASASRCTYTFGNALIAAAETLRDRILQRAADLLMARDKEELALLPGIVRSLKTGFDIPLGKVARFLNDAERVATGHFRAPVAPEPITSDQNLKMHGMAHTLFSYAAQVAQVQVDELTGQVEVLGFAIATDCGTVINPQVYEQQIQGGISQGLGYALLEELSVREGTVGNPNLSTYLIPTAMDIPDMECMRVEIHEPTGPFGLKGVGEVSTTGPLPAVANAVADACGIRVSCSPLTAERVLNALRAKHEEDPTCASPSC
jgi:CO/xanthine dehydrogenase Mo-binding subunit